MTDRRRTSADPHPDLVDAVAVTRFWRLVDRRLPEECWPWLGDRDKGGYGVFYFGGRMAGAHELALSFTTGEKRHPGLDTCHSCDYPACVNPAHLRFDTRQSNVDDMVARRGPNVTGQKLTDEQIVTIRERRALGARQKDLAAQFGVSEGWISAIVRGLSRADAGGPIEAKNSNYRKAS